MLNYLVIGLCLALLIAVIYFSIKPISMGIEARRNINDKGEDSPDNINQIQDAGEVNINRKNISDEILNLNKLKEDGILSEEEYEKAKKKLLD